VRLFKRMLKYAVQRISQFLSAILYNSLVSDKGYALNVGVYYNISRFYISFNNIILN
jgi:hypothetical protein